MSNHVPTPWDNDQGEIKGQGEKYPLRIAVTIVTNNDIDTAKANAAFIVRAVNNHEALVEAIEFVLQHGSHGMPEQIHRKLRVALQNAKL